MMQHRIILSDKVDLERVDRAMARWSWGEQLRSIDADMLSMAAANHPGAKGWFVLSVKPNREKSVSALLSEKNVVNFLPLLPGGKRVLRGRVVPCADRPALPGYVLVSIVASPAAFAGLVRLKGIEGVVGGAETPHRIQDEEINRFKVKLGEWDDVKAHAETFRVGDWVRFDEGPFIGFQGVIRHIRKMVILRGMKPVGVEGVVAIEVGDQKHEIRCPLALLVKL